MTTSEMISCEAVLHGNKKTFEMLARGKNETPFAIQVFGSNPKRIALASALLEKKCDVIDVNLGCPSRPIVEQGAGAALLKSPEKITEIFDELTVLRVPVTAKMRLGFSSKARSLEIARIIEKRASALTVHGRTMKQGYSGKVDLEAIARIKSEIGIPVIGNGNIFSPEDAEKMIEKTTCDSVMVGRGALGNPFIFRQMNDYFADGEYATPSEEERKRVFLRFLTYSKDVPAAFLRAQAMQFATGFKNAIGMRRKLATAKTIEELKEIAKN